MLTGRVTGTVARIVAAEGTPLPFASATVSFSAQTREFPADTDLVIPDRVTCRLDAQGRILDPTDTDGVRLGVELAASENIDGGFSTEVRVVGPTFTTRVFDIIVRSGETIDIATAVHVPAQPGQVVDRLAGLVDQVQGWVDDPTTLPDVGPAVEAAAGSASAAAESAQQARESATSAAGSAGDAHSDRVAAEAAAQAAAGSASTATTAAAHVDEVAATVDGRAGDAEQAATQAAGARDTAVGAAQSASASASTATTQAQAAAGDRLAAQEARTGAETAQGKAQAAQQGSEDARDAAHGSALAASGSASDAQDAVNAVPTAVTSALSTWFLRGNGSPVGVVKPASAGVQYVDIAATNGASIWVSTGTTTASWRVVAGDTGWRNLSSQLDPAVFSANSTLWVRRTIDTVDWYVQLTFINGIANGQAITLLPSALPVGFGNMNDFNAGDMRLTSPIGSDPNVVWLFNRKYPTWQANPVVFNNGASVASGGIRFGSLSNRITSGKYWPTTLPGTPA